MVILPFVGPERGSRHLEYLKGAGAAALWYGLYGKPGVILGPPGGWPGFGKRQLPEQCISQEPDLELCSSAMGGVDYFVMSRFSRSGDQVTIQTALARPNDSDGEGDDLHDISYAESTNSNGSGNGSGGEENEGGTDVKLARNGAENSPDDDHAIPDSDSLFPSDTVYIVENGDSNSTAMMCANIAARLAEAIGAGGVVAPSVLLQPRAITKDNYAFVLLGRGLNQHLGIGPAMGQPDPEDAIYWYKRALRVDPGLHVAREALASMLIHMSNYRGAALELEEVAIHNSLSRKRPGGDLRNELLQVLAQAWLEAGNPNRAAQVYLSFLNRERENDPEGKAGVLEHWETEMALAEIRFSQERYREAEQHLKRVLAAVADHGPALGRMAAVQGYLGVPEKMVEYLEKLARVQPNDGATAGQLASVQMALGNKDEAVKWYRRALSLQPDNMDAVWGLALLFREQGKNGEALQFLSRVMALETVAAGPAILLGELLVEEGRHGEAAQILEKAAEQNGEAAAYCYSAAGVQYSIAEDHKQAVKCFMRAAELEPSNVRHHYNLGTARMALGNIWGADNAFMAASARNKHHGPTRFNRGLLFLGLGRTLDGAACFRQAIRATGDNRFAAAHYNLGVAMTRLGHYKAGTKSMDKYRELRESKVEREK